MCTRYSLHKVEALKLALARLGLQAPTHLREFFNIALTTKVPAVVRRGATASVDPLAFGLLLPPKDPGDRPLTLANARSETFHAKPTFREALAHRRCLVPADGFFEWEKRGRERLPHYFRRRDGDTFFFAGLWRAETEVSPPAFVIVTTTPNELLAPIHDRMPVMLEGERATEWLGDQPLAPERVAALCTPFPAEAMMSHTVHPRMNSARHEAPDCIEPWTPPPPEKELFD